MRDRPPKVSKLNIMMELTMDVKLQKGIYQHYKGKNYEVLNVVRHSETLEEMVVYRSVCDDNNAWVRPLKMFIEDVEFKGQKTKRFIRLSN